MLKHIILISLVLLNITVWAQTDSQQQRPVAVKDSVRKVTADTKRAVPDTLKRRATLRRTTDTIRGRVDTATVVTADTGNIPNKRVIVMPRRQSWKEDTLFTRLWHNPYLPIGKPPVYMITQHRVRVSKDGLFYVLTALLLLLGFIRASFPKYFSYLFTLIRQTSFRQKQTREQLLQGRLPSLMMNLLFLIVAGLFISVVVTQKRITHIPFWTFAFYSMLVLAVVYSLKFLFLRFTGWVFRVSEAAETYIFIVFLVNKLLGVFLIPLLWLLAFSEGNFYVVVLTITTFLVGFLLLYRYILSLAAVRNMVRVSPFHFFIYLCAVEILPVLLIYKIVFSKIGLSI